MAGEVKEKSDRKTQILSAAEHLFSERGYLATSMRDLAEAQSIEAASLYSHFASKDELLWRIAQRCANEFFSEIEPITSSSLQTQLKLREMILAHIRVIVRNLNASAVFFSEWRHLTEPRRTEYAMRRDAYEDIFRTVIRKGIEENLFRHYDDRFSTRAILSALNWTHTWYRHDGELRPEQIGNQLADILLEGLVRSY
jgi:TetR/AcrR family transcriptional regulator, cholesterol catabolism regulator